MANKARPWLKFWPQDWICDPQLRSCTIGARGLLIDLMAIAHGCDPYGYLMANGQPLQPETITKLIGMRPQTYRKHIANLSERSRVAIADNGALYIPRMVKDAEYASKQAAFGKKGGNPTLKGTKTQTLKPYSYSEVEKKKTPIVPVAGDAIEWWNPIAKKHRLAQIRHMPKKRLAQWRRRLGEGMGDVLPEIAAHIARSDFLRNGSNGSKWRVNFDWLVGNETNWIRVVEGQYDGQGRNTESTPQIQTKAEFEADKAAYEAAYQQRRATSAE